jgi:hypothetical protein
MKNQNLILNRYLVSINTNQEQILNHMFSILNEQKYPRGIMEILEAIEGVSKIEIYDKNSNELLLSTTIV